MAQWISLKKRKQSEFYCEIEEVIDSSDDMDDAPYEHPLQQETVTSDYSVLRHTISVDVMSEMSLGLRSLFGEKNGEGSDEQINMEKLWRTDGTIADPEISERRAGERRGSKKVGCLKDP